MSESRARTPRALAVEARSVALLSCGAALGVALLLGLRNDARLEALQETAFHRVFTSAMYVAPAAEPALLLDGRIDTCVQNLNVVAALRKPPEALRPEDDALRDWEWPAGRNFIQAPAGLSHEPGRPPQPAPLQAIRIWPGDQSSPEAFRRRARPRSLRLVFFYQQLVDFDREYRLPERPLYAGEGRVALADAMGVQEIAVTPEMLPPRAASPGFPREVAQIWVRIEILDWYAGEDPEVGQELAVSELSFVFPKRVYGGASEAQP